MTIRQSLLGELDHEAAGTRKTLERMSAGRLEFRPHPRSRTMGWLAGHIAQMALGGTLTCKTAGVDRATGGRKRFLTPDRPTSRQASTARTFAASASGLKGFWMKSLPS